MNETNVFGDDSMRVLIKLKNPTQPPNNIYDQIHRKVVDTLNFLICQNFENGEVTEYTKDILVKVTLTFQQSNLNDVKEVMNYLINTASISNWIMTYSVEDDVMPTSKAKYPVVMEQNWLESDIVDGNVMVPVNISLSYCENAFQRIIERDAEMREISDMTNLIARKDLDPKVASEIRKKFRVEGFDELSARMDEFANDYPSKLEPIVPPMPKS